MTIGLCTDSASQLPPELAARYGIEVVPLTIVVDDEEHLDGVDLDADGFYDRFSPQYRPTVSTSHPSSGQFAVAYDDLADRGCTEILSVHMASSLSGTINAARLAAHGSSVPIRLIDTGTVSFGVSCCLWAAAEAIAAGAGIDEAGHIAESLAPMIGNVFVVGALDMVTAHGVAGTELLAGCEGIPLMTVRGGKVEVLERVTSMESAVRLMAAYLTGWGDNVRVALGRADRQADCLTAALRAQIRASNHVSEVIDFRIGPAVGAHTGPGTVGGFVFPGSFAFTPVPG